MPSGRVCPLLFASSFVIPLLGTIPHFFDLHRFPGSLHDQLPCPTLKNHRAMLDGHNGILLVCLFNVNGIVREKIEHEGFTRNEFEPPQTNQDSIRAGIYNIGVRVISGEQVKDLRRSFSGAM